MTTSKSVKSKQKAVKRGKNKIFIVIVSAVIIVCGIGAVLFRYFEVDFWKHIKQGKTAVDVKQAKSKDILAGSNSYVLSSGNAIKGTASVDLTNYGKNDLVNDIANENVANENSHNSFVEKLLEFDDYLYENKYNPGTTADLTAASIFLSYLAKEF